MESILLKEKGQWKVFTKREGTVESILLKEKGQWKVFY